MTQVNFASGYSIEVSPHEPSELALWMAASRRIIREWPYCRPGRGYKPVDPVAHARSVAALRAVNRRIAELRR